MNIAVLKSDLCEYECLYSLGLPITEKVTFQSANYSASDGISLGGYVAGELTEIFEVQQDVRYNCKVSKVLWFQLSHNDYQYIALIIQSKLGQGFLYAIYGFPSWYSVTVVYRACKDSSQTAPLRQLRYESRLR